ncbi:TRAP transporter small permease [Chloroflexota bacterium]
MTYVTGDVTGRYLFNNPLPSSFEIVQATMVFVVFLGLGYSQSRKAHFRVEFLIQRVNLGGKVILELIALLLGLAMFTLMTWQAGAATIKAIQGNQVLQGVLDIPHWPSRLAFTVGIFALSIQYIFDLLGEIRQVLK